MSSAARMVVWLAFVFFGLPVIAVAVIAVAYAVGGAG